MIKATYIDHMGNDLSVVNSARVSFGKKSEMEEEFGKFKLKAADAKLVRYLADHEHYSPFGHCFASFHIKAPVFVARQLVKHEYLRMNEVSRRYVDSDPEFYSPEVWRGRSPDKKQGSAGVVDISRDWGDQHFYPSTLCGDALSTYRHMVKDLGVAPEMARMVLPQSMMTEWYWSGSLDAFANMCKLRIKPDTQYESRLVAYQISNIMSRLYPVSWSALTGIKNLGYGDGGSEWDDWSQGNL